MKTIIKIFLLSTISFGAVAQSTIYTNDMDYVIGDVKQAFIKDLLTTPTQINNLLEGYKTMQVNGIRIPIFAEGHEPRLEALQYFYTAATNAGFDLMANPVHWNGGQRVANGVFEPGDDEPAFGGPVKDDPVKTQNLIDRILDYDKDFPCKWINPFNEDGSPNGTWSTSQMNTIYQTLSEDLLNAELVGACPWGIPAGIKILKNTNVKDYVTVSTTHNLGFNHTDWTEYINLSHAAGLPAWDSEVNHNRKFEDKATRLEAALEYGVDGLVLYDSWRFISLTTGEVNNTGQEWMSMYLKPTSIDEVESVRNMFDVYSERNAFSVRLLDPFSTYDMTVLDVSGKVARQMSLGGTQDYSVDNLQPGVYIVVLKSATQVQQEKVMVY